jgi:ribose 5-phosphate isomerase B
MRIALAADHAGLDLKEHLRGVLEQLGHAVQDLGTHGPESVDYPDFAAAVGRAVAGGQAERGLLVCGTGVGMAMAANKIAGVRAADCNNLFLARLARAHNDANVLALGAREIAREHAAAVLQAFLETPFDGGRHQRRIAKISALE